MTVFPQAGPPPRPTFSPLLSQNLTPPAPRCHLLLQATRAALAAEEPRVDRLQAQLTVLGVDSPGAAGRPGVVGGRVL